MDGQEKLAVIFQKCLDDYSKAYERVFWQGIPLKLDQQPPVGSQGIPIHTDFATDLVEFINDKWEIDFLLYDLDKLDNDVDMGKEYLRLMLDAYSFEMEDVQADIGIFLRKTIKFIQDFAPKIDFLNEVGTDSYVRRPLDRLWQMEPLVIFEDMSVSDEAEVDALLDALEKNFSPMIQDIATLVDHIRKDWFSWYIAGDQHEELIFYETLERTITHSVTTESRIAAADWVFQSLDGDALLVGILEICRRGLECLTQFCGNYKFISENRLFIENLVGQDV